ncbi:hypothetical protein TPL01_08160 [Sulfuriferula plumbiphila]|uniref:Uncharacterized protein n=1 Tax=Sulfuriferula plumbiphila TaxID=171865 RepID=A0A512L5B8_9PROT|nr:hypothetical protein SFPGR_33310 [Sulfuriferula plumbiphila]GEP29678.1 hypothetical protein TPL01_08160 [Sulfuriferula plumbiphila]
MAAAEALLARWRMRRQTVPGARRAVFRPVRVRQVLQLQLRARVALSVRGLVAPEVQV